MNKEQESEELLKMFLFSSLFLMAYAALKMYFYLIH